MRIAICFSGHLRSFDKTYEQHLQTLITPLSTLGQVDIFISTWETRSIRKCWAATDPKYNQIEHLDDFIDFQKIYDFYKPISTQIDCRQHFLDYFNTNFLLDIDGKDITESDTCSGGVNFFVPMWFKIWQCNQLKKQHELIGKFTYDIVIRMRFDWVLRHPLDLSSIKDLSNIFIDFGTQEGYTDQFFISSSKNMDKVCNLYCDLKELFELKIPREPEKICKFYIERLGINIQSLACIKQPLLIPERYF